VDLILVRHGLPIRGEPNDPRLCAEGLDQARRAAEFLRAETCHALYSSPLRRAMETAEPIAAALGCEVAVEDGLAEYDRNVDYHHWDDLLAARDPRVQEYLRGDLSGWGADVDEFRVTVVETFDAIVKRHKGERVVVVSHGGVANMFFGSILGLQKMSFHAPVYGSVSRARYGAGTYTLVSLNESGHLPDRAQT
jgi:2,3-bisphosphoglycerate-dependent phosphoglycerate mutase